ncbi:MAG: deoxyribodipyrimidine photo-lyase, partial [Bacteroidota bacterium]
TPINIVWLKRDLRLQNHAPLHAAEKTGLPYRIIYIFDTELIRYPDTSTRHLQFVFHSLQDINIKLKSYRRTVDIYYGTSENIFSYLIDKYHIDQVFSHEETGIQKSWDRDKKVGMILNERGIGWREFPTNGIVRGITNRDGWDKQWFATMHQSQIQNRFSQGELPHLEHPFPLPKRFIKEMESYPKVYQPAGETQAWKYLKSFMEGRGNKYHFLISKPTESRTSCSRISTYLAWGNISVKQVYQYVKGHSNYPVHKRPFAAFLMRLKWHCHFVQKFEVECTYETHCVNRGYELLERDNKEDFLTAWALGKTGYPMVDACMRAVTETGWLNFRMRAMLVSFLCHHLDQDWRKGTYHLAKQFLDYEPGIHYPQFQMQAGTTGINTVRIYNPVKQSQDHDTDGIFIKKWVPELQEVPVKHIHEPWKMTDMEQQFCGVTLGTDYPLPIVDLVKSGKKARQKIWGHRKNPKVQEERQRILKLHTRRG